MVKHWWTWVAVSAWMVRAVTGATVVGRPDSIGRVTPLVVSAEGRPGFTTMKPESTGVEFVNHLPIDRSLTNHILMNGSGVALGDMDGDGWCDLFFAGLGGGSTLYRNLGGWRFTNVTATAFGRPDPFAGLDATGAVFADLDGDGNLDLLVNSIGQGTRCWRNDGRGQFREVTEEAGLGGRSGGSSFALADIDGDGDLDLYVVNYRTSTIRDEFRQRFEIKLVQGVPRVTAVNGRPVTEPDLVGRFTVDEKGRITEHGEADQLFFNDGKGRFTAVSFTGGAFRDEAGRPLNSPPYDWGLAAQFRDLNGDRAPDLYVCNDLGSPERIWINDGQGGFQALARTAVRKTSWFSMGVDFGDLNRDGLDDFFVTDMLSRDPVQRQVEAATRVADAEPFVGSETRPQIARNTLLVGRGNLTFSEVAWAAGVAASDWSWSPVLLDVDLDGFEDILIGTGFERNVQDVDVAEAIEAIRQRDQLPDAEALQLRRRFPSLAQANLAFRNRGDLTLVESGEAWGFQHVGISQGMAVADLDRDGDLDVVLNNQGTPALLLRNDSPAPRLAVRLRGQPPNTQGIGARITVTGGPVVQSQEVISGGRFLSGDDPIRVFAAGSSSQRLEVTVDWRRGGRTVLTNVAPNQLLEVLEPAEPDPVLPTASNAPVWFRNVSDRLEHRHQDLPFDDFVRQPLLPRRLSQLGPALCWGDLNGDGTDDLVVGSGQGGRLGVFLNDGRGGFAADSRPVWERPLPMDAAGILISARGTNRPNLLIAFSQYEASEARGGVRILDLTMGAMRLGGPTLPASIGPLAQADVDGDGELDLFLGGRVIPGRFPEPAPSALFRGSAGGWVADPENTARFARLGMVSGAVFTDLDGDGDPDLVVACDWGPLRIFFNEGGQLTERDWVLDWEGALHRPTRLGEMTGWWNGVMPVDLDGDGRLDLVAANWGRNHRYQVPPGGEVRLYAWNQPGSGSLDLLLTRQESPDAREIIFDTRGRLLAVWPDWEGRFPTRRSLGEAPVPEVLKGLSDAPVTYRVNTLESLVLLNRGDRFVVRPLPAEAQWSPAFGIVAADFDGDGAEDLFLSQNFFGHQPETERDDAGLGLVLQGNGQGGLVAVAAHESGVFLPGEQRGAAAADFDQDGRVDLAVAQSQELTQLLHNTGARPGLRIRLQGPAGNPTGVGVQLRLVYADDRMGPVREVHAGAGYWSQDSSTVVLGKSSPPKGVWVRWPGSPAVLIPVASNVGEVTIKPP